MSEENTETTPFDFFRDVNNYILMGNDIMRMDYNKPTKLNEKVINWKVWTSKLGKTETDYQQLEEYDGFVCKPNHIKYQRVYGAKWNTYSRVKWDPEEGEWPTIEKLIRHQYGKNAVEEDQIEEFYDYHTLLVTKPWVTQQARFNYSHQQKTSKSALATLEEYMFQDNYSKIRDSEFESTFNSIWVNSLILHLDEPAFDNKKKMSRIIRDMVTSKHMNIRKMRTEYEKTNFFAKLLITTNDSDFMTIEKGDRRYWIREIPPFPLEDMDPDFNRKMKEEVNHYLYFLMNREMKYAEPQDETFWLPQSVINTNGFKKLVGDNRSPIESQCEELIESWFMSNKKFNTLCFTTQHIIDELDHTLDKRSKMELTATKVVQVLRDSLKLIQPLKTNRPKAEDGLLFGGNLDKKPGRWWTADREDFDTEPNIFGKIGA